MNTVSHSKLFSAHRTLDTLKVDPPHLSWRDQPSAFRADVIKRRLHLFEIDLPSARHGSDHSNGRIIRCAMAKPYEVDVLKLIELTQNAMIHALTLQEMYQEGLQPEDYDRLHAKHENLMSAKFQLLRSSVDNPEAFSKAVGDFQRIDPKTRPH
jgi:hypothetical protein